MARGTKQPRNKQCQNGLAQATRNWSARPQIAPNSPWSPKTGLGKYQNHPKQKVDWERPKPPQKLSGAPKQPQAQKWPARAQSQPRNGLGEHKTTPPMVLKKWSGRPPQQSSGEPQSSRKLPRNVLREIFKITPQNRLFVEPKTAPKWSGSSTAPNRSAQQKRTSPTLPLLSSKHVLDKLRRQMQVKTQVKTAFTTVLVKTFRQN